MAVNWRVEVYLDGKRILAIEPESVCGVENMQEFEEGAIREAANNLLAFVGPPDEAFRSPEDRRWEQPKSTGEPLRFGGD